MGRRAGQRARPASRCPLPATSRRKGLAVSTRWEIRAPPVLRRGVGTVVRSADVGCPPTRPLTQQSANQDPRRRQALWAGSF